MADVVKLEPIKTKTITIPIEGVTPLITHAWSEKAQKEMRDKKAGKKTRTREACDPEAEFKAAAYKLSDGSYGFPATGIKNAMTTAAHKDVGIPRTVLRRGLFVIANETPSGGQPLVRIKGGEPIMREDTVRVGNGSTDLRYRPEFTEWSMELHIEFDTEWLTVETIVALLQRAGFGVGLGDWRPERGGDFGRFEVVAQAEE